MKPPRLIRGSLRSLCLFAVGLVALTATSAAQHRGEPIGPEQPREVLPRFYQIEDWEVRSHVPDNLASQMTNAAGFATAMLEQFTGAVGGTVAVPEAGLSPLEWPHVFPGDRSTPRSLRQEMESRMQDAGINFRELIALERGPLSDSIARAIADGEPVLLNAPGSPVLFGYDRREPDAWWWMQIGGSAEILLESERAARFVYWADDPASNVAWAIMGPNTNVETPEQEEAEFAYLATIDRSVQGDASIGLRGYPFSVRAFRDSVAAATRFPVLKEPVAETDPIGIRRALSARRQLSGVLESLSLRVVDTTVSRPLRLALYFYHNSTQSLERVETLLYQGVEESSLIDRVRGNWQDGMLRPQAANALNDALEWERQAAEQIALALASHNPRKR